MEREREVDSFCLEKKGKENELRIKSGNLNIEAIELLAKILQIASIIRTD